MVRGKLWRWARRAVQTVSLVAAIVIIVRTAYPLAGALPYDIIPRFSPLLGAATMLAARAVDAAFWPALLVLGLTLLFGRAFCGWVCPLGAVIDFVDWLIPGRKKEPPRPRYRFWRFAFLIVILVIAAFGLSAAGFLDPLSVFPRSVGAGLYSYLLLGFDAATRALYQADRAPETVAALRKTLLPAGAPVVTASLGFTLLFVLILALGLAKRRFYCRYICPTGAFLSVVGWASPFGRRVDDSCVRCGKCETVCRMGAMIDGGAGTAMAECTLCMDCLDLCKMRSVGFGFGRKRPDENPTDWAPAMGRRGFLAAAGTGVVLGGASAFAMKDADVNEAVIRPPGYVPEAEFLDRCVRCGQCMRVCLTGGLVPAYFESGLYGLWTPRFDMRKGYCEYFCTLCTEVCPSGAIEQLDEATKVRTVIGLAVIDEDLCLPFAEDEDCIVCEEHCPTTPKAIELHECKRTGVLKPRIVEELCIGCGICSYVCPVEGPGAVTFVGRRGYVSDEALRRGANGTGRGEGYGYGQDPYAGANEGGRRYRGGRE
ncbi:MAG: 4Fe-4S binding protein [Candidatus Coatesbacteria bacterium]|nr:MAG: 4Fe-4S binding protein [Candidatus Coatesbacteria bacterium]